MDEIAVKKKVLSLEVIELPLEIANTQNYVGKRFLDQFLGSIGMVVFLLLYPFFAIGIKLSSRGPVLFKQARTGYKGEKFYCYKFRTMHNVKSISSNGTPAIAKKEEKRIFPFGKLLRKTNLDEFPQMINVLKGEMSLVGPRPYPVDECKYWNNIFEDHSSRYSVLPGITGFAQVKGYRGGTLNEKLMRKRLNHDLIYTENIYLSLDIKIIFKTISQMLFRINI